MWKSMVAILLLSTGFIGLVSATPSPFDDLSPAEIQTVVQIIRNSRLFSPGSEFPTIGMQEPKKSEWLAGEANDQRLAHASVFDFDTNILSEVVINLRTSKIVNVKHHDDGISPTLLISEAAAGEEIIRNDPQWQGAILKRGIQLEDAVVDVWLPGSLLKHEIGPGKRIIRGLTYYKNPISRFYHWGVVEGVVVMVDLAKGINGEVIEFWDDEISNMTSGIEVLEDFSTKPALTPLTIEQPEGNSIQINGQEISWYKWRMRYSVDPTYGLQLYHVTYNGDCKDRSVLYKISIGEMFVPYGAAGRSWRWRSAFDAGEYGFGKNVGTLKMGVDIPENGILLNCTIASETGGNATIEEGCVGAFERDIGILYKHQTWVVDGKQTESGDSEARRGRQLVLTLMTTISNYDYFFDYIFHMDGVIEVKSRLTGIVLARGVQAESNEDGECLLNCTGFLNDYLVGPPHQHYFSYRIDLDVDGVQNYVAEVDVTADPVTNPDPTYPWDYGMFSPKKFLLETETSRDHNLAQHRSWHVINPHSRNDFGSPRGYALKTGDAVSFTYLTEPNPVLGRVQFVKHPFWATRYHDDEQHPTSKFPRTGKDFEGLPAFIKDKQSLNDEDSVLWYTFGVTHSTRAEEYPIMNVHFASGFSLVPYNFLSQNSEMALKDKCP